MHCLGLPPLLPANSLMQESIPTAPWAYFEHPSSGSQPPARSSGNGPTTNYAYGPLAYYVSWDIEVMDTSSTWLKMMVRCQYLDRTFNQWHGTTVSSFRFRD